MSYFKDASTGKGYETFAEDLLPLATATRGGGKRSAADDADYAARSRLEDAKKAAAERARDEQDRKEFFENAQRWAGRFLAGVSGVGTWADQAVYGVPNTVAAMRSVFNVLAASAMIMNKGKENPFVDAEFLENAEREELLEVWMKIKANFSESEIASLENIDFAALNKFLKKNSKIVDSGLDDFISKNPEFEDDPALTRLIARKKDLETKLDEMLSDAQENFEGLSSLLAKDLTDEPLEEIRDAIKNYERIEENNQNFLNDLHNNISEHLKVTNEIHDVMAVADLNREHAIDAMRALESGQAQDAAKPDAVDASLKVRPDVLDDTRPQSSVDGQMTAGPDEVASRKGAAAKKRGADDPVNKANDRERRGEAYARGKGSEPPGAKKGSTGTFRKPTMDDAVRSATNPKRAGARNGVATLATPLTQADKRKAIDVKSTVRKAS